VFIGALFLLNVLALAMAATFKRSLSKRKQLSTLLRDFLSKTAYWIIFAVGAALVLSSMGFNLTPLMAAFGGASFIIGFATQSTLSNLASGLLVMVSRPFDVGDKVNIAGVSGTVESVTSISTVIRDAEGRVTIVPNKKVWDSVIINEGRPDPA
jgi:small conductance mechanosensitive channel